MTECSGSFALPGDFAGLPARGIAQAHLKSRVDNLSKHRQTLNARSFKTSKKL